MNALALLLLLASGSRADAPVENVSLSPPVLLPDGSEYKTWENRTAWTRTYVVDQHHPEASDANAGTPEKPFRTIGRAAQVLQAGERVVVKSGVYREEIRPAAGGTGPDRMIGYEAAPGARVIVKGSRVLGRGWRRSRHPNNPAESSEKLWMLSLDPELFDGENPFAIENASAKDLAIMPWATDWAGRFPFALRRGMVFQDGRRLEQLAEYADLAWVPGSFWVEPSGTALHVHPDEDADPREAVMEVTVRAHLVRPARADLGYIRIAGFTFQHAGNGFPRTGVGAVFVRGGHHWLIEDNTVADVNSVAIEIGSRSLESADETIEREDERRARRSPGFNVVRDNHVYGCGRGGIQGLEVRRALVERNFIHDCGWWDVERLWETGGVKLLVNEATLVQRNRIERITGGPAVWLDWNNKNSRVTRNLVVDTESCCNGALFVEASRTPNMIDHNVLWGVKGTGVFAGDTDNLIVAHNLIGPTTGPAVRAKVVTDRTLDGRVMTARGNRVLGNVLLSVEPVSFSDPANTADHNVFASPALRVSYDRATALLSWSSDSPLPLVPAVLQRDADFFATPVAACGAPVGPFADRFAGPVTLGLSPLGR